MTRWALAFPLVVYLLIAVLGYYENKNLVNPNFLLDFHVEELGLPLFSAIYISFIFVILLSFPIKFYQGRNVILWVWDSITGNKKAFARHSRIEER